MKKTLLLPLLILGLLSLSFLFEKNRIQNYHTDGFESVLFSSNPPPAKTGAPGETNCTSCHSGSTMSAEGLAFFTFDGGPNYVPGLTYNATFSSPGGPKNGFELTILNEDDEMAGSFIEGDDTFVDSFIGLGREYVSQTSAVGKTSWTFKWVAPEESMGILTAYYAVNKSDYNGSTSGDEIFLGSTNIALDSEVGIEEVSKERFSAFFNTQSNELNLDYTVLADDKIVLNIQNLSGKLIKFYDFGNESSGVYSKKLALPNNMRSGVYLIALFIGNDIYNQKLMFH